MCKLVYDQGLFVRFRYICHHVCNSLRKVDLGFGGFRHIHRFSHIATLAFILQLDISGSQTGSKHCQWFGTLQIRRHIRSIEIPDFETTSVDCTHVFETIIGTAEKIWNQRLCMVPSDAIWNDALEVGTGEIFFKAMPQNGAFGRCLQRSLGSWENTEIRDNVGCILPLFGTMFLKLKLLKTF